ncbi:hypothetical protein Tco_0891556 [Tanacetum coccineum]|uniref:Uncharacterized protein n=1 Tax=Tanacetum coccineum TaxID=301880 RepID=A0ABQ5C514_9ASTR
MDRSRSFPYKGESHKLLSNLVKSPREILATERVAKTFERPLWLLGPNWSKDKTRYCHFHKDYEHETNKCQELKHQIEEAVKTGQLTHLAKGVTKKREKTFETQSGEKKKEEKPALEKTSILMRLMEEEGNSTNNGQGDVKDILSCIDTEEKIVIDDEYPEQKVTIGRQLPTRIKIRLQDLLRAHVKQKKRIKSDSEEEMLADIEETLGRLKAINLKLNPRKCSFGVEEGIYSGHLITKQAF